jgi:hypothetical protein
VNNEDHEADQDESRAPGDIDDAVVLPGQGQDENQRHVNQGHKRCGSKQVDHFILPIQAMKTRPFTSASF